MQGYFKFYVKLNQFQLEKKNKFLLKNNFKTVVTPIITYKF